MLGRDLAQLAPAHVEVVPRTRAALDVTATHALAAALDDLRPDLVINASAYTQVDRAESEPDAACLINADAVGELGALAAARGVGVVHFSTDYVFDGAARRPYREDDPTAPLGVYGASKLAGERHLLASQPRALVLRTQWLYGAHGRSFVRTMWERATRGAPARVVNDQRGAPTWTADLAHATWALVARGAAGGVYHAANTGEATWFDVARHIYAAAGCPDAVTPCATADYPTPARRPAYGVLDTAKLARAGVVLRPWPEALDAFIATVLRAEATRAA